jgi:hypothetical protein
VTSGSHNHPLTLPGLGSGGGKASTKTVTGERTGVISNHISYYFDEERHRIAAKAGLREVFMVGY